MTLADLTLDINMDKEFMTYLTNCSNHGEEEGGGNLTISNRCQYQKSQLLENMTEFFSVSTTNTSQTDTESSATCWQMLELCWCNIIYIISAFAILGNLFTLIIILNSPKLRQRPTFVFLSFLAAADFGVMAELSIFCMVFKRLGISIQDSHCIFLNIANWINDSTLYLSFGFILLVTIQRFTIVYFPFCGPKFFSQRRSIHMSIGMVIVIFLCNLYVCWIKSPTTTEQDCKNNDNSLLSDIRMYSFFTITSISWLSMLVLCIAIMHRLHRHHINHKNLLKSGHESRSSKALLDHYNRTHIMLMTNVVAFIVLQGPVFVTDFMGIISPSSFIIPDTIREVIFMISKLNHCVNFLLYVLTCKEFRSEITKYSQECNYPGQKSKSKGSNGKTELQTSRVKRTQKEMQKIKPTTAYL